MPERKEKNVELITQYLSSVLIPRLNQANSLYSQGRYVDAIDAQIQIIKTLYRRNEDEKKVLVEWTERFDKIVKEANKERGYAQVFTTYKRIGRLRALAKKLYDELGWEIWDYLHKLGYFTMPGYRGTLIPTSTMKVKTEKPEEQHYPERLPEELFDEDEQ